MQKFWNQNRTADFFAHNIQRCNRNIGLTDCELFGIDKTCQLT